MASSPSSPLTHISKCPIERQMANLGKIVNSLFSATSENTLALANLNFDFSIVKYEAPKEFQVIGTNLSNRRRDEAEDGKTHKIAARLGALFKSIVPPTPNLINAYGRRASEITALPKVNPKNNSKYGPFAEFVGIDGTSLWAAATSARVSAGTHAPLAMHLLACILARRWESSIAISIWVELVQQRQLEIEATLQDDPQHISSFLATKHDVSREDLASWDASARAWLQSADEARNTEKTKFDLIAKNISVEIGNGQQTYENVIEVWRCAMQGMELLIHGTPQELSSGAILLALSAWHLYPDLIILGKTTKKVEFRDPLISLGGTVTVGLQYDHDVREPGMHWSLTLSHLRYYEEDVKVDARSDMSRVSMKELLIIAFGSLMKSWGVSRENDVDAALLLIEIRRVLLDLSTSKIQDKHGPGWLRIIALASKEFLDLKQSNGQLCDGLTAWGRRNAQSFLASRDSSPFFGLTDACVMEALTSVNGYEAAIPYFRKYAEFMADSSRTFVIRYREQRHNGVFYEFATAVPHIRRSAKPKLDGSMRVEYIHKRWLRMDRYSYSVTSHCNCIVCGISCPCRRGGILACDDECHPPGSRLCQGLTQSDLDRCRRILCQGEECRWISGEDIRLSRPQLFGITAPPPSVYDEHDGLVGRAFRWRHLPPMLCSSQWPLMNPSPIRRECPSLGNEFTPCTCAEPARIYTGKKFPDAGVNADFSMVHGDLTTYCLFMSSVLATSKDDTPKVSSESKISAEVTTSHLHKLLSMLRQGPLNKRVLRMYLTYYDPTLEWSSVPYDTVCAIIKPKDRMSMAQYEALMALNFAQKLYKHFSGASIPLTITTDPLSADGWLKPEPDSGLSTRNHATVGDTWEDSPSKFSQSCNDPIERITARCFACIIFFESGIYNVSTSDCLPLIAVASGNSIFMARYLMSDPDGGTDTDSPIQRVTGNVGKPGISMLVIPQQDPRVRPRASDLRVVPHLKYDDSEENNFSATSLHLRFTGWRRPYNAESRGAIDEGLFFVESTVSVHDSGRWVCDLDVQGMQTYVHSSLLPVECICDGQGDGSNVTSIDCWEELLDPPDNIGIVRAKNNWPARLAAFALRCQQNLQESTLIVPVDTKLCRKCIAALFAQLTGSEEGVVIN